MLGQLLFLVYINDLDDIIVSALFKFADDGKMLHKVMHVGGNNQEHTFS